MNITFTGTWVADFQRFQIPFMQVYVSVCLSRVFEWWLVVYDFTDNMVQLQAQT